MLGAVKTISRAQSTCNNAKIVECVYSTRTAGSLKPGACNNLYNNTFKK